MKKLAVKVNGLWIGIGLEEGHISWNTIPLRSLHSLIRHTLKYGGELELHTNNDYIKRYALKILNLYYGVNVEMEEENLLIPGGILGETLEVLKRIPKGRVASYGWLGLNIGVNPRLAGKLLGKNPFPLLYPCHRVVRKDGSIGGYSYGIKAKKEILEREGVRFKGLKVYREYFINLNL
ncbi:MAG: hypothetical protein DRN81_00330 [Thermoproteota archaeon]|nr:MAG: hypothetical protein DRN81_00330 [Candidatus Korarchaeota archaeon]